MKAAADAADAAAAAASTAAAAAAASTAAAASAAASTAAASTSAAPSAAAAAEGGDGSAALPHTSSAGGASSASVAKQQMATQVSKGAPPAPSAGLGGISRDDSDVPAASGRPARGTALKPSTDRLQRRVSLPVGSSRAEVERAAEEAVAEARKQSSAATLASVSLSLISGGREAGGGPGGMPGPAEAADSSASISTSSAVFDGTCPAGCGCLCMTAECLPDDDAESVASRDSWHTPMRRVPASTPPRSEPRAGGASSMHGGRLYTGMVSGGLGGRGSPPLASTGDDKVDAYRKEYRSYRRGHARGAKGELSDIAKRSIGFDARVLQLPLHRRTASSGGTSEPSRERRIAERTSN
jgi:hypothetical protein